MHAVNERLETVHVYVVPEEQLPTPPDYGGMIVSLLCSLVLVGMVALIVVSPQGLPTVALSTTIKGYSLPAVRKTEQLSIIATGKGYRPATVARGRITFYNGQTYSQIIPADTILQGTDGVAVVTESQAIIPPAAQTTPPTYGSASVPAHALHPGVTGNIAAGDINEACCVTSVIAQNPSRFTGGSNARDFSYLSKSDVARGLSSRQDQLQHQTLSLFVAPLVLAPTCSTASTPSPAIGQETTRAVLTITTVCTAISYSPTRATQEIIRRYQQYADVSNIHLSVVGIQMQKGGVTLRLYVTAVLKPVVHTRFGSTGK